MTEFLSFKSFSVKQVGDGSVYIEGYANKAVADRAREIIEPSSWKLDNYLKNPIILYNHGQDPVLGQTPVGKAVKVESREDGLYIKARISSSKDVAITRIRELITEEILQAFSVGFETNDSYIDDDGIRHITDAELYEVSIVGVPMNQDSLFTISGKSLNTKSFYEILAEINHERQDFEKVCICEAIAKQDNPDSFVDEFNKKHNVNLRKFLSKTNEELLSSVKSALKSELKIDDEVQMCVIDKIPKLIEEGYPREQAIAIAFAMCEKKQETAISTAVPAAAKEEELPQMMNSPYLQQMMQTNVLLGSLIAEVQKLQTIMQNIAIIRPQTLNNKAVPLTPSNEMSREELRQSLEARSAKYEIEITEDAALTFPEGFPQDIEMYGDPVNLKFPYDTIERANNARVRFKQFSDKIYKLDKSKAIVHERIVRRQITLGIKPSYDENDHLDLLLPKDLVDELVSKSAIDKIQKKLENIKHRINNLKIS